MKTKQKHRFRLHKKYLPDTGRRKRLSQPKRRGDNSCYDPTGILRLALTFPGLVPMPVTAAANGSIQPYIKNTAAIATPVQKITTLKEGRRLTELSIRFWTMVTTIVLVGTLYLLAGEYGAGLVLGACFACCGLGALGAYTEKTALMGFSDLNITPYVVGLYTMMHMPYLATNLSVAFGVNCALLATSIIPELLKVAKPPPLHEQQEHKRIRLQLDRIAKGYRRLGWEVPFPYEYPEDRARGQALVYAMVLLIALMLLGNLFFVN